MKNEILKAKENINTAKEEPLTVNQQLSEALINSTILLRKKWLEEIKPKITLKAFYAIEEKILAEEKELKEILNWQLGRQTQMAKFTFILDSRFFEQEFLH